MPEGLGCASHTSAKDRSTFDRAQINGKDAHVKCILQAYFEYRPQLYFWTLWGWGDHAFPRPFLISVHLWLDINTGQEKPCWGNSWCSMNVWRNEWMNEPSFSWALTPRAYTLIENHFHQWNICILPGVLHVFCDCMFTLLIAVATTCYTDFTLFYLNLIFPSPYNLEGAYFIICAFLMFRSPPPPGPATQPCFQNCEEGYSSEWHYFDWVGLSMWKQKQSRLFRVSTVFSEKSYGLLPFHALDLSLPLRKYKSLISVI